jgi:hypothetical protein
MLLTLPDVQTIIDVQTVIDPPEADVQTAIKS